MVWSFGLATANDVIEALPDHARREFFNQTFARLGKDDQAIVKMLRDTLQSVEKQLEQGHVVTVDRKIEAQATEPQNQQIEIVLACIVALTGATRTEVVLRENLLPPSVLTEAIQILDQTASSDTDLKSADEREINRTKPTSWGEGTRHIVARATNYQFVGPKYHWYVPNNVEEIRVAARERRDVLALTTNPAGVAVVTNEIAFDFDVPSGDMTEFFRWYMRAPPHPDYLYVYSWGPSNSSYDLSKGWAKMCTRDRSLRPASTPREALDELKRLGITKCQKFTDNTRWGDLSRFDLARLIAVLRYSCTNHEFVYMLQPVACA